jgi:hypothetical protein
MNCDDAKRLKPLPLNKNRPISSFQNAIFDILHEIDLKLCRHSETISLSLSLSHIGSILIHLWDTWRFYINLSCVLMNKKGADVREREIVSLCLQSFRSIWCNMSKIAFWKEDIRWVFFETTQLLRCGK